GCACLSGPGVSVCVGSLFVLGSLVLAPVPVFLLPWRVAPIPVLPVSLEDRSCSCVPVPWRAAPAPELPVFLEGLSCSCSVSPGGPLLLPCSLGTASALSVSGHVREASVLRRTPEPSPVQEDCSRLRTHRCSEFPAVQGDCVCVSGHVREVSVLRRTPESSPVQEDCSRLRTHRCSKFPAVQGDCVWFGDSPMDLGRLDAASRSPCGPGGLFVNVCSPSL
ncbi:hypothetical protein D4764_0229510, partial [Takifugu flavidus]